MKDVIIKQREEGESHPQDEVLYRAINGTLTDKAFELRATGEYTDEQIIAMSVRAVQQLAADATALAEEMGVNLDV